MSNEDLTHEELVANQGLVNLKTWTQLLLGYLKEKNEMSDFTKYFAKIVLPGWNGVSNAIEFCKADALNYESHGCEILHISGNEKTAQFTILDNFTDDDLKFFKTSVIDSDRLFNDLGKAIAQGLNLTYTWSRDGNKTTIKVVKTNN